MFRTKFAINGIDCGWAVLNASAGDWIEIVDGELGAPRNAESVANDFKQKHIIDVDVPSRYYEELIF